MTAARVERRLAAILAADVAGYSRLMGADEEGTLGRLKAFRKTLVDPKIAEYRGRIVKTTGDGMLVEFGSAVDAVRCAVEVQRAMGAQQCRRPPGQAHRTPHRHPCRRHHHRRRRHFWRRRQHRRAAGRHRGRRRHLHFRRRPSADAGARPRSPMTTWADQSLKNITEPMRAWRAGRLPARAGRRDGGRAPADRQRPRRRWRCPTSRRSRCCRSRT